jgi:hypothetical protein
MNSEPTSKVNRRALIRLLAVAGVLAVSLLSSGELARLALKPTPMDGDSLYLRRFDDIKKVLPSHGVVCYMPSPQSSFDAKKHYFLAQYALAPLIVRTTADCDPVIGDFPGGLAPASADAQRWTVLKDFGNGVLLLGRNTRP